MIIDFALQEAGGTLAEAFDTWTEKARDKAVIDHSFHVAITDLRDDIKAELPDLAAKGVASGQDLHGLQGNAALHRGRGPLRGPAARRRSPGHGPRRER